MNGTGLIRAYSGLMRVTSPLLPLWLNHRARKGKEDPARQGERFGKSSLKRPSGQLFWMHGASVGETTMLLPLIEKMLAAYPKSHILVTSGTITSAALMAKRLPQRAFHQYVPLDTPRADTAFLDYWKPDLAIWAESEIWPNLLLQTKARNIPMALINARMSEKSIHGWYNFRKSAQRLFGCFDIILAGDSATAKGLSWLLGKEIKSYGSLKEVALTLPVSEYELEKYKESIGNRPVWCAASTHRGEEEIILTEHDKLREKHPDALLVLALRHPERINEILDIIGNRSACRHSSGMVIQPTNSVYIFDIIGEMGLAYSLADITFVCGSLVEGLMGHNPLEPARFSNAVLTGKYISSFADSYRSMIEFGAAERILSPTKVGTAVNELFSNPDALAQKQRLAFDYAQGRNAVLDIVWDRLKSVLPKATL